MLFSSSHQDKVLFIGRVLIALLFLVTGLQMLLGGYAGTVGFAASVGVPMAGVAVALAILFKLVGSVMLILGYKVREVAYALVLFVVLTIVFFHLGEGQLVNALKNVAIIGALLYVSAVGPGSIVFFGKKKMPMA